MDESPKPDRFLEAEEAAAKLLSALDALQAEVDSYRTAGVKLSDAASHIEATLTSVQRISNVSEQAVAAARQIAVDLRDEVAAARQMAVDLRADIQPIATDAKETAQRVTALESQASRTFRMMVAGMALIILLGVADIAARAFFR